MTDPMTLPHRIEAAEGADRALDADTFKLRRFVVSVEGWGESTVLATTRGKALADTWRSDAFGHLSFGEFLKFARCRLDWCQPKPTCISVGDELVWGLGNNGQYVQFVRPNGEFVLHSHPLDVLPDSYRPRAYQRTAALRAKESSDGE